MDSAYDHIQEESYPQDPPPQQTQHTAAPQNNDFNSEIQDAYKAISSSPWAARLGGFLGSVKKQGEQYYETASKQLPQASANATAGISTITSHIRALSVQTTVPSSADATTKDGESTSTTTTDDAPGSPEHPDRPESLPADIVKEAEGMLARFRSKATERLKDIEKAEDAADEALLKFGANIRNFLKDAVTIAPPSDDDAAAAGGSGSSSDPSKVLFESKDSEGKRVIHTTRFDAQLHVIHSSLDSFLQDPVSPQWEQFKDEFKVDFQTEVIAKDLEKHEELRRAMEKLVPEKVKYKDFWARYYYLRFVIESEEQRRRDMLKASTPGDDEEIGWDEDSENEDDNADSSSTPQRKTPTTINLAASKDTLKPEEESTVESTDSLKAPSQPRRSNDEKSVADSDASYDLVSGAPSRAPSRAPGSPQDKKKDAPAEDSDEEDWE